MMRPIAFALLSSSASACSHPSATMADAPVAVDSSNDGDSSADAAAPRAEFRGIYVVEKPVPGALSANDTTALATSGVDGVLLHVPWNNIEPTMGGFHFYDVEQRIETIAQAGRVVELSIDAGADDPAWLFAPAPDGAAVQSISLDFSRHSSTTNCNTYTLPLPWDTSYAMQWTAMVNALAADLRSNAMWWNAIRVVKLSGINTSTEELRLPLETPAPGSCITTDAPALWAARGYTPANVVAGWVPLVSAIATSFPDKIYSITIIANDNAFPPIDDTGTVVSPADAPDVTDLLIAQAVSQVPPSQVVIQSDFLMPGAPAGASTSAKTVAEVTRYTTLIAFQTNDYLGPTGGAACGGTSSAADPCIGDEYEQELESGIHPNGAADPLRAQYLEVYAPNVVADYGPAAVQQAHDELFGN